MAQEINATDNLRLHAIVEGHVQGVGFRYFVIDCAQELGLSGWVRNTFEGNVELFAEGSRPALEKLLANVQRGPRAAFVLAVHEEWQPATGQWSGFTIKPTV